MATIDEQASNDLAARLRRWIVVGGYFLGGWAILESVLMVVAWGNPFLRTYGDMFIDRCAKVLYLGSPLLLFAGCWGFQHHRRWARPVLLTYAVMWIAGVFGVEAMRFINSFDGSYLNFHQQFAWAVSSFDLLVYASVFPVFLVLCLARPEVRDHFAEFRPGFAPILHGEEQ